jgi:hypothetical protein
LTDYSSSVFNTVGPNEPQLFVNDKREPQFPQKCIMPGDHTASLQRRLGEKAIAHDVAQEACAKWEGDEQKHCIFDVMATGDLEVAQVGYF